MIFRLLPKLLLAIFFVSTAGTVFSQTVYDAKQGRLPLSFGAGMSNYDAYFAQGPAPVNQFYTGLGFGRMWGATGWADAGLRFGPAWIHPMSVELQYRSLFAGGSLNQSNLTESSVGGGLTYTWRQSPKFRPYVKYIMSYGMIDFKPVVYPGHPDYSHDSRFTNAAGGGFEYRVGRHVWLRADYEYQFWGKFLGAPEFMPQGITVGAMYRLNRSIQKQ
ncbi:MAG TPA: outer membrane beta-barrel protein [Terracidiphilus sp.]|nr:outer membrane beta-barrel protein [Terracidiphilus sp.]